MAQQKQKGGKAGKGAKRVADQASQKKGRAAFKKTAQYLRGPKDGGPTQKEVLLTADRRIEQERLERVRREHEIRMGWRRSSYW